MQTADYVIVGAGSAGAVLANRLSEDPATSVILIEAGGEARSWLVELPVGFAKMVANNKYDWCYEQQPDPSINGRHFIWSGGRMLGGSSSINGQVYIRGTRRDFDRWAELGAAGWDYDGVLPYFMRSEDWRGPPGQGRGSHGPLTVSPQRDPHPLCRVFLAGCDEFGLPTLADYNAGGAMEGAFLTVGSQRDGWRCSTEKGYLRPARARPNLTILTQAEVERVRIADGRAVGVTLSRDGVRQDVDARRDLILSAGAMGTPALLMRSGIGPGAYLQSRGIAVVHDSAGVGQNLQEHPAVLQHKFCSRTTLNSQTGPVHMALHMARLLLGKKGPLVAPAVQAMGLTRTDPALDEPDIQLHFLPFAYDLEAETVSSAAAAFPKAPAITIAVSLCHPRSRGRVELEADGRPRIVHELLGDGRDLDKLVAAVKLANRLFQTPSLAGIVTGDRTPRTLPTTDEGWADYVRSKAMPSYHPVGTCRMGADAGAVVDPQLRVRGLAGLRIADASIMPSLPSGNTNAASIMIGEKAADLIAAAA